ncbi:unnamed protein product [Soboliphyme baturini]|uniref:WD_REPEATS_REGION domain-containing protein n=1 Tax=Soboliphyme baturini TaxID=241478 RepID=A0A183INZ2_9BILA|nr:unnamed protein product [Soboliphyme baturini]
MLATSTLCSNSRINATLGDFPAVNPEGARDWPYIDDEEDNDKEQREIQKAVAPSVNQSFGGSDTPTTETGDDERHLQSRRACMLTSTALFGRSTFGRVRLGWSPSTGWREHLTVDADGHQLS